MTLDLLRFWAGGGLAVLGGAFVLIGAIGLVRMPDVFSRLHAASVIDTAGAGLILLGLVVIEGISLVSFRLVLLILMFGLLGPVAAHAVARAALYAGVRPKVDADAGDIDALAAAVDEGGASSKR